MQDQYRTKRIGPLPRAAASLVGMPSLLAREILVPTRR